MKSWRIVPALVLAMSASASSAATIESVRDVLLLLQSGLSEEQILRSLEASPVLFTLDADAMLSLHEAGATDSLIAYLALRQTPPPVVDPEAEAYRIFRRVDDQGRERVVLTNLDDEGRRLPGSGAVSPPTVPVLTTEPTPVPVVLPEAEPAPQVVVVPVTVEAPPAPAPAAAPAPTVPGPYYVPYGYFTGGIVGSYSYPQPQFFLGYGPTTKSTRYPSSFGTPGRRAVR